MAIFGMAMTVCTLLAKKYPDGYSLDDLFDEAKGAAPWLPSVEYLQGTILGDEEGHPHSRAMIACWTMDDLGIVRFNPSSKRYSNYDDQHFKEAIEKWFQAQGMERLSLRHGD